MTAEMAEVVAARALLADFQRITHEYVTGTAPAPDWPTLALRLAQHLQMLVDAVGGAA